MPSCNKDWEGYKPDKPYPYTNKSFKIKRSVADEFKRCCAINDQSMASVITKFMKAYIQATNGE